MRYQRQSEIPKKGNPEDHEQAVKNVVHFLKENAKGDWFYWKEWREVFNQNFNKKEGLRSDYEHSYDIAALEYTRNDTAIPFLFIEVDGEKHSKQGQQYNDQVASRYVIDILKIDIIRLDKVECNGKPSDRNMYFRQKLRKYIK